MNSEITQQDPMTEVWRECESEVASDLGGEWEELDNTMRERYLGLIAQYKHMLWVRLCQLRMI